jgi:hypothetical protein
MKHTTAKQIRDILAGTVECDLEYPTFMTRRQDDTDGSTEPEHEIVLGQGPDGDMHIKQGDGFRFLRFRTPPGGGGSPHTHNALRILAHAMQMDAVARPQRKG